jgi:phosphoribosyl-AMP cyclohydrolase
VILLKIEQIDAIACHTGRHSCFFQKFTTSDSGGEWLTVDPVLKDPAHIYK